MGAATVVKERGILFTGPEDPYDECVPGDVTDPTAVSRQVAALLRAAIFAGTYPSGSAMPTQKELVVRHGYSEATMYRALAELARDGLISMGPGRKTTVLARRRYRTEVAGLRWTGGAAAAEEAFDAVAEAVSAAEAADPAVSDADLTGDGPVLTIAMDVEAANPARAADIAWAVAESACGDGWDLSGASVEARPADGDQG